MSEIFEQHSLDQLKSRINRQVVEMIADFVRGDIPSEEDFSTLLADRIAMASNHLVLDMLPRPTPGFFSPPAPSLELLANSIKFKGRALTRKGGGTEEKAFGADILFVLDAQDGPLPFKGMLAQSKAQKGNFRFTADRKLFSQCSKMYLVTRTSSFAFIYARNGLFAFDNPSATGVDVLQENDAFTIGDVVSDFVACRTGDTGITEFSVGRFAPVAQALQRRDFEEVGDLMGIDAAVTFDTRST